MIPGYRYRYAPTDTDTNTDIPNIPHTKPITDTRFIPIFFIPIPGIGTWYRYRLNSSMDGFLFPMSGVVLQFIARETNHLLKNVSGARVELF